MSAGYIPQPKSIEEYFSNVQFQLDNVQGYLGAGLKENAHIKAQSLVEASAALELALRKATRGNGQ